MVLTDADTLGQLFWCFNSIVIKASFSFVVSLLILSLAMRSISAAFSKLNGSIRVTIK